MPKPQDKPQITVECIHCGQQLKIVQKKFLMGDVLTQYPGGGKFGQCRRCRKWGQRVIEVPKTEIKKPVGWTEVPNK